jgi:hypothetical protein
MTTSEEKLMRSVARDLTGPFWDSIQAEVALAKIKQHFTGLPTGTGAWFDAWAAEDEKMAERFCFRDDHQISHPDRLRIIALMRQHREKYAQDLLRSSLLMSSQPEGRG